VNFYHLCASFLNFEQSTVLLNADIAFLAIPQVAEFSDPSLVKIAAFLSAVASFGSIVLGLLLINHERSYAKDFKSAPSAVSS
jgi:predicted transporter